MMNQNGSPLESFDESQDRLQDLERELELLACELHDGLLQLVTAAHMMTSAARIQLQNQGVGIPTELDRAQQFLRQAAAEGRQLLESAQSCTEPQGGGIENIQRVADSISDEHGTVIACDLAAAPLLSPGLRRMLFRIAREALNNVGRHSQATQAEVSLKVSAAEAVLTIRDDGCGFDPALVAEDHFGLQSMRRRAALIGGACEIVSQPEQGTTVTVRVPMLTAHGH